MGVSEAFQLNGLDELEEFSDDPLYDDGTHGDVTANDDTYTNNGITTESTVPGHGPFASRPRLSTAAACST